METKEISVIKQLVEKELSNKETVTTLVATTFKGLQPAAMKQAMVEGMMRGFTFRDFLEKNIYAVPFGGNYSLVTSIDHSRKIGMRSGVIGKSAPVYTEKEGKIETCSVTIKRKIDGEIGEFTSLVYFSEYTTGKNLWATKPRTMIAKVAEMHALRMACPEELAQSFVEEEMIQEAKAVSVTYDIDGAKAKLEAVKNLEELSSAWSLLPMEVKKELTDIKDVMKSKLTITEAKVAVDPSKTATEVVEIANA